MSILGVIYLLACIVYLHTGMVIYLHSPSQKMNRVFFLLCLQLALWSLMLSIMNALDDAAAAAAYRRTAAFFWSWVFCLYLHFCLILVKRDGFLSKPLFMLILYSPALISIYMYYFQSAVTQGDIILISYGWAYIPSVSRGFIRDNFLSIYCSCYSVASICLLYDWGRKASLKRERIQSRIILFTFMAAFILGTATDVILPKLEPVLFPPLSSVFILIPIIGFLYSGKKYRLMKLGPENVAMDVMKEMREGLLIMDERGIIKYVNVGASEMLGFSGDELKGRHFEVIFPEGQAAHITDNCHASEMLLKTRDNGEVPVLFSTRSLLDKWGEPYGSVSLFQDMTETKGFRDKLQESFEQMELKVAERTKELNAANEELKKEIKVRIEMEDEIRKLAFYDPLTGLPNRRLFNDYLTRKIYESQRNELPLSVMFLDLDSFKLINDSLGHARGDALIRQVADRLLQTLRISDTIARIGGDEFLVMIQNTPNEKTSDLIACKILETFRSPFNLDGYEVYITASIGIAMYPVDGEDGDTLIKNADIAMYRAKEKGKNKYEIYTPKMKTSLIEIMKLTNLLYRAIDKEELELYYQPQVDINTGNIVGLEALIRWNHPEHGRILSGEFIPIAEKTGLIVPIGEWVLRTACRTNREWQRKGYLAVPVAVNLSIKQFMDVDMVDKISRILEETQLEPHYLEIEITEGVIMKEVDTIGTTLEQLKRMGIGISIDDFGTEYSSLNYLKRLPIDRLKIAMTFVQGIGVNRKDEAIINAIIALANNLEIKTIAEGVENISQVEFLRKAKCDFIQGYYMYKPVSTEEVEKLFAGRL